MKIFVPQLGTEMILIQDWTFVLYTEQRNLSLFDALGFAQMPEEHYERKKKEHEEWEKKYGRSWGGSNMTEKALRRMISGQYLSEKVCGSGWGENRILSEVGNQTITIPQGTVLKLDRIYIRKGAEDFDSMSFRIVGSTKDPFNRKGLRFWAKLSDVQSMEFDIIKHKET